MPIFREIKGSGCAPGGRATQRNRHWFAATFRTYGRWQSSLSNAMKLPRRKFLCLAAGATALEATSRVASALDYPTRPVHIVVGFPPGLAPDIVARLTAQALSKRLGQQFIVDNRPGAASNIGTEMVARAVADGYTILLIPSTSAYNATLYKNLNFDLVRDIAPVASVALAPFVMVVTPSFPAKTVPEFIAYAKANPGKVNMASAGNGTAPHLFGALFMVMAGVILVHVPYRSSYVPDLLGGQVQVVFTNTAAGMEFIRAGKLRALAVTTATRVPALPEVPTLSEFLPGYEASGWYGIGVPKRTSNEIIAKLNHEIGAAIADPDVTKRLLDLGNVPLAMTPTQFGTFMDDEIAKWAKVIQTTDIRAD
jgi:tripartite-type tricarboxylate transporter receptor subunit TctC